MDLRSKLEKIVKFLLKKEPEYVKVYIYKPSYVNLGNFCIVIEIIFNGRSVKASSTSKSLIQAFIKALSELGENIVCDYYGFNCRSGIAGGLLLNNSIDRAKAELVERDAFFYHYRNIIPFLEYKEGTFEGLSFRSYKLCVCDPRYYVYFTTTRDCALGKGGCLIFGMGASKSRNEAMERSIEEFSTMHLNHELFPEMCKKTVSSINDFSCKADFHHSKSRDPRNVEIIKELCMHHSKNSELPQMNKLNWKVETLESPLNFFKYVKLTNDGLTKIEFGIPEETTKLGEDLYHPFW